MNASLADGSPAALAGLENSTVLVAIDDQAVGNFDRLRLYIARSKPGASIRLRVASPAGERTVGLTLADRKDGTRGRRGFRRKQEAGRLGGGSQT